MVWRGRDGAPFPLSLPNPSKNKGGRTGEQGKVGFHQKPPKSTKKSLKIIIGFAPRRFGVFCAHPRGRRIELQLLAAKHWRQTAPRTVMVALRKRAPCGSFGGNAGLRVSQIRNPLGGPMVQHSMTTCKIHHLHVQTAPWRIYILHQF